MAGEYIEFNNNTEPALNDTNINRLQQLIKQDIQGAVSGDTLPIGAIMPFGSDTIPGNWLLCDGQAVSRTEYQDLFNNIGTAFGNGDGFTTFNLPDFRKRVPVGKDENDTDFDTLGNTGGEKTHTLTVNEMPAHNHEVQSSTQNPRVVAGGEGGESANVSTGGGGYQLNTLKNTGGGQAHNILQPYIVQNYIIKAKQSAGIVATVVDSLTSTSTTDALSAKQGKVLKDKIDNKLETGTIKASQMSSVNYEGAKRTYTLSFTKTYTNTPNVIVSYMNNKNTVYGMVDVSVGDITNTSCQLNLGADVNSQDIGINYLIISND